MRTNERFARCLMAFATMIALLSCTGGDTLSKSDDIHCQLGTARAAKQAICIQGLCANGSLDERESCDDGNQVDGDGCSSDCRSTEVCGNGIVDHTVGEVCDDGNIEPGDQCCGDCRSCPGLAVLPLAEYSDLDIERAIADALPCHSGSASVLSSAGIMLASLVPRVLAPHRSVPAPLLTMAPAPAPLLPAPPLAGSSIEELSIEDMSVTPAWLAAALEQARTIAKEAEKRLKSEKRKHKRLKEAQVQVADEVQRLQQTVAQLEQINAELHQYVAAECQQIKNGRSEALQ